MPCDELNFNKEPILETLGSFTENQIERVDYYLTPRSSDPLIGDNVKLGVRYTLKNGEKHGNVIKIPFLELRNLVLLVEANNFI